MADEIIIDLDLDSDEEVLQEIPQTGINGFERPLLYTTTGDPEEILNLGAGSLRIDNSANAVGNILSGSRSVSKNLTGVSAYSFGSETSVISNSLGGIAGYTNVGSFTTSVYNPNLHVGFGTYGAFGNSLSTNGNGSLVIVGNKKSIIDGYFVGIGTTVGIATFYGSAFLFERISNNFVRRDCIVGQYSSAGYGATHGTGIGGLTNDDYGYSTAMAIDGKTFAVGGPNVVGLATTSRVGVVWVYEYNSPTSSEFCGVGTLPTCCGIGTSTFCEVLESKSLGLENSVVCGVGTTNICRTENVNILSVLEGDSDGDLFGQSLAISADSKTLVVGSPGLSCTTTSYNGGGAYVYDRNDNVYDKVGILTGASSSGTFGNSVSVSGDGYIIAVGDPTNGKSYVYERNDKVYGSFDKIGTLTNGGTQVCVSDDGETIITSNGSSSVVYDRSGSTFTSVGTLSGGSVGISCSPDGKIISTASASGYNVYNREGNVFYLNDSGSLSNLDSFDMSANTKVIYRGSSTEAVSAAVTGKVYCDDQSFETFVYTDPSGNIGVGTTTPTRKLDVNGSGNFSNNLYVTGITTSTFFVGDGSGLYNINYSGGGIAIPGINTAGVSTFTDVLITRDLTVNRNGNFTGIVTAGSFVSSGTTAVYAGSIGISTVDSNTTSFHYVTFDTTNSAVNISNFTSGKKFEIVCRNSSVGAANLIIRTSTTSSSHAAVPRIVHSAGNITNGTISVSSGSGLLISVFNMGGTIVGTYWWRLTPDLKGPIVPR